MGNTKNVILGILAAATLFATGCATDEDYYEGEIVPTRPNKKPSLNPSQPSELTGSQEQGDIPGINQSKLPGTAEVVNHGDGRIEWANTINLDGEEYTELHNPNYGTGIDHVDVIDQSGETVSHYDTKITADRVQTNVIPR
jgi:hypothetical protein